MNILDVINFIAAYPLWIKITVSIFVAYIFFVLVFFAPKIDKNILATDNRSMTHSINMEGSPKSAVLQAGRDINIMSPLGKVMPEQKSIDDKKEIIDNVRRSGTPSKSALPESNVHSTPPTPAPSTKHPPTAPSSSQGPIGIYVGEGSSVTAVGNIFEGMEKAIVAEKNSQVDARGNVINKGGQGSVFPPPTGEFSRLSSVTLRQQIHELASTMRAYEADYEKRESELLFANHDFSRRNEQMEILRAEKFAGYKAKFSGRAISLTSECLHRVGPVEVSPSNRLGSVIIQRGMLVGPHPMSAAADFLEHLTQKLP